MEPDIEGRGLDFQGGGCRPILIILICLVLIAGAIALGAWALGTPQDRARARGQEIQAEAYAYQARTAADTSAAAERAAIREAARQAGHERALEMLPFLALTVGGLLLGGGTAVIFFAIWEQRQVPVAQPELLYTLRRLELEQARTRWLLRDIERGRLVYHEPDELVVSREED